MPNVTFKGTPVQIAGSLPTQGKTAPAFQLTGADLADVGLDQFKGKKKVLNIVPSLDTGVCATSAKKFNEALAARKDVVLLNISADLPFAAKRFCDGEKLDNVVPLSTFRAPGFGTDYGVAIQEGPLAGLMSRAVLVLDEQNRVLHAEQVPEITQEPNYAAALAALG